MFWLEKLGSTWSLVKQLIFEVTVTAQKKIYRVLHDLYKFQVKSRRSTNLHVGYVVRRYISSILQTYSEKRFFQLLAMKR